MNPDLLSLALGTAGWMTPAEGIQLYTFARIAARLGQPLLEIGSYCGRSTVFLGAGAAHHGAVLYSVDHHRGSDEHQPGADDHDPAMIDPDSGRMDTLVKWRRTIENAQLESTVIGIVGDSRTVARYWNTPLSLLFIDGGHDDVLAWADFTNWSPHVVVGGFLLLHDVYAPDEGGGFGHPWDIYLHALGSGEFAEAGTVASLRCLRRVAPVSEFPREDGERTQLG